MSQLHQSPNRPPASSNQNPARVITGVFDPLEMTQTQTQLGTLTVTVRLKSVITKFPCVSDLFILEQTQLKHSLFSKFPLSTSLRMLHLL